MSTVTVSLAYASHLPLSRL